MYDYIKLDEITSSSMPEQAQLIQCVAMTLYPIKIELMAVKRITAPSDPDFKWLHLHMTKLLYVTKLET